MPSPRSVFKPQQLCNAKTKKKKKENEEKDGFVLSIQNKTQMLKCTIESTLRLAHENTSLLRGGKGLVCEWLLLYENFYCTIKFVAHTCQEAPYVLSPVGSWKSHTFDFPSIHPAVVWWYWNILMPFPHWEQCHALCLWESHTMCTYVHVCEALWVSLSHWN